MLKQLRRRFITLSMIILAVVLIVFYLFTTAILFLRLTESVQNTLRNYASVSYASRTFDIGFEDDAAENFAIDPRSICVVEVKTDGEFDFVDAGQGYMEENLLRSSIGYVLRSDYDFGHLIRHNVFYFKTNTDSGYRIAFADSSRYFSYLKDILVYDGFIFLVILLGLYFITRWLASMFIKPVEKAWTQQQNFIADASHELKTPLTVILANSNILLAHKEETVEDQQKWIDSTNEEASHMKDLVDKMLYLAKSESMKAPKITGTVNISELVTKLILQFEPVAFEAGVTIESDIEEKLTVRADSTAVNQIIHILVDNAVKYAGLGGTASVKLRKKQNNIYLSVKNTGAPIPPEDLPHIFERFYRSDKARTAGSGYGLGLAICKSLAEQQKATISVSSDTENGTEFTVRFPKQK